MDIVCSPQIDVDAACDLSFVQIHSQTNLQVYQYIQEGEKKHFLILDNARNQKTDGVINTMEISLGGRYAYIPAYSPELNPIEHAFSIIRHWIRDHEHESLGDPMALINRAFHLYSIEGELGYRLYNLFDLYRRNHNRFIDEIF